MFAPIINRVQIAGSSDLFGCLLSTKKKKKKNMDVCFNSPDEKWRN